MKTREVFGLIPLSELLGAARNCSKWKLSPATVVTGSETLEEQSISQYFYVYLHQEKKKAVID